MMIFSCGTLPLHNPLILRNILKGHFQEMSFKMRRFVR